jgi:acyl carrier protein
MKAEAIDLETMLADIGADSISLTKFVFHLEREFRVTLPDDFTMRSTLTVGEIVDGVTRCAVAARLQPS